MLLAAWIIQVEAAFIYTLRHVRLRQFRVKSILSFDKIAQFRPSSISHNVKAIKQPNWLDVDDFCRRSFVIGQPV